MKKEQKASFLQKIWAHDAPWYLMVARSGAAVIGVIAAMPYAAALLPGEPVPDIPASSLRQFYRAAVDFGGIKLHSSKGADAYLNVSGNEAITVGATILLKQSLHESLKAGDKDATYILAHEIGHVYQNKKSYTVSFLRNLWGNLAGTVEERYDYSLKAGAEKGWTLDDYGIEQQADILADYYNMRNGQPPRHNRDSAADGGHEHRYRAVLSGFLKERGPSGFRLSRP